MSPDLDLRDSSRDERRDRLFAELDDAAAGDAIDVAADYDATLLLCEYQIDRERQLDWEFTEADGSAFRVSKGDRLDDGELPPFDVRALPPQHRHSVLLDAFDGLDPDEGFVLVNDHDPKPLSHELRSTRGDAFDWDYRERGPDAWRVEIVKTEPAEAADDGAITKFDVREIPKRERHSTIHHRYGMIPEGETMEIVAPHEPRPLHREFRERYGDSFAWEVVESEPGRCRVHVTKEADAEESESESVHPERDAPATDGSDSIEIATELDVRDLPPAQRHEKIFASYDDLGPGQGFVLVNDHDPKPLYHQFDAEAGDEFRWEYRQREPGEFRVLIGKAEGGATGSGAAGTTADESPSAPF